MTSEQLQLYTRLRQCWPWIHVVSQSCCHLGQHQQHVVDIGAMHWYISSSSSSSSSSCCCCCCCCSSDSSDDDLLLSSSDRSTPREYGTVSSTEIILCDWGDLWPLLTSAGVDGICTVWLCTPVGPHDAIFAAGPFTADGFGGSSVSRIYYSNHQHMCTVCKYSNIKNSKVHWVQNNAASAISLHEVESLKLDTASTVCLRLCSDGSSICYSTVPLTFWPQIVQHSPLFHNASLM